MKTNSFRTTVIAALVAIAASTASLLAQEAHWYTDYEKALEKAKAENKNVLLDFTGSDWCGWCMKMDKDVLKTKEFKEYASKNLVLVEVDFPQNKQQTNKVK